MSLPLPQIIAEGIGVNVISVYVDEIEGSDDLKTRGTLDDSFQSLFAAYLRFPPMIQNVNFIIRVRGDQTQDCQAPAKSAVKKATARHAEYVKKRERDLEEEKVRLARLAEAKNVILSPDPSLPEPVKFKISSTKSSNIKLGTDTTTGTRVKVVGRIENMRVSKTRTFVYLSDTRGILSCMFTGEFHVVASIILQRQAAIEVFGEMKAVPEENHAPDNRELHVDHYNVIGEAPGGPESFSSIVPSDTDQAKLSSLRHLVLRRPAEAMVMKARASTLGAFRQWYKENGFREHNAPSFVQTQAEGGGSLFTVPYYGQQAYLTQTAQLYLETQLPVL
jgi:asparaginyl-tRNA synthetase